MTQGNRRSRFSFSQDEDFTELVIIAPTKTVKNVFYKVILPAITSGMLWLAHNQPIAEGQQPNSHQQTPAIPEQVHRS
ncbi:MAG: hypothetical protein HC860_27320 [Alkalinema sp. RU_4_3]|nr:hypothetical protein [Alkalinema sp. RU_4_3]